MHRVLREPLLHFFVLGALLFASYGLLQPGLGAPDEIVVSRGQVASLVAQFARTWQRPPTAQELDALVENWVREEVFYREGLALGLDRDDPVVRRRIGQKVEFLADGEAATPPTDAQLQAWLDNHADDYRIEPRYWLRQLYFDPARHGARLDADIAAARIALARGESVSGDTTMLPESMDDAPAYEVARTFGSEFSEALATLPIGDWSGPVRSGFGLHLVQLQRRESGRPATLNEVRNAVERDLLHAQAQQSNAAFYARLRERYTVRREDLDAADIAPGEPAS